MTDITWSSASDWDNAAAFRRVVTDDTGVRNADEIALGYGLDTSPVSDAVGYWHMDDSSGDLTEAVNGYTATASGLTYGEPGPLGTNAIGFDGSSSTATASVGSDITGGGSFTIAGWMDREFTSDEAIIRTGGTEPGTIYVSCNYDGITVGFHTDSDSFGGGNTYGDSTGQTFFVGVYDEENGEFRIRDRSGLRVSGVSATRPAGGDGSIYIGHAPNGESNVLNGSIGALLVWDYALPDSEARDICDNIDAGYLQTSYTTGGVIQDVEITASVSDTTGVYGSSYVHDGEHGTTESTSERRGLVVEPTTDIQGLRMTIADPGPSGYSRAIIAERRNADTILYELDVSNVSNGEAVDLNYALSSGTPYVIHLDNGGDSYTASEDISAGDFPYTTDEFSINGSHAGTTSSYTTSEFSQFSAVQSIYEQSEDEITTAEATVYQDTNGDGTAENSETIQVQDGTTTHPITQFEDVESEYRIRFDLETQDTAETPVIQSATLAAEEPPQTYAVTGSATGSATTTSSPVVRRSTTGSAIGETTATATGQVRVSPTGTLTATTSASAVSAWTSGSLKASTTTTARPTATYSVTGTASAQGTALGRSRSDVVQLAHIDGTFDLLREREESLVTPVTVDAPDISIMEDVPGVIYLPVLDGEILEELAAEGVVKTDY